ncbi:hypothetical protein EV424DRAFT_1444022 [Suillus variegatus]|nr:hypothetical protein EV424DRAFT_1444022 [Suillus variegatus]
MSHKSVDIIRNGWIQGIQSRISFKLRKGHVLYHLHPLFSCVSIQGFFRRILSQFSKTYASPPNLRVCWRSDSSADMYQTCPELSMNTQAPAARYIVIYLSTNERGQRSSSANTQHLLIRCSLVHTQDHHLPRGNSRCTDPVGRHGILLIPEGVLHPDMLLFALRRFKDQSFRRP